MDLSGNQLSGEIPTEFGDFTDLERLDLSGNQLSGEIPPELGDLTKLTRLSLSGNQFKGCIPGGLNSVPYNDLSSVGLPFCSGR